ncbi:MAG: D-proline reductase (dithiol) proprotein PrdA, partial [Clostridium sp.]|nr:D-proline reductase (dithiol) proprotein PrdA [Clostridium sp.]
MSMSKESIKAHLNDPAIFCCQRKKGLLISEADLEDPTIFPDLEESGLLTLTSDGLKIVDVLGTTLIIDVEALTPITVDMLDGVKLDKLEEKEETVKGNTTIKQELGGNDMIHVSIDKLEGLSLDIPAGYFAQGVPSVSASAVEPVCEEKII